MDETERIVALTRERGILRPRDLVATGIRREHLDRAVHLGRIERIGRGLYTVPDVDLGEHHGLAEVVVRVPHAVICLLSALRFHEIGTQDPFEVWIAIDRKARRPRIDYPPVRVTRFSGLALTAGVERHDVGGVALSVYSVAKTVADCFKYRNKVGLDVAMEALRDCVRQRRCTIDDLWRYATICRVVNVMRPYLEAVV